MDRLIRRFLVTAIVGVGFLFAYVVLIEATSVIPERHKVTAYFLFMAPWLIWGTFYFTIPLFIWNFKKLRKKR
jgi:hypothetical protein